jgi:hypothetical protein
VQLGVSTLQQETAELSGADWEAVHEQRAKEVRLRKEAGLEEGSAPASDDEGLKETDDDGRDDDTEDEADGDRRRHVPGA